MKCFLQVEVTRVAFLVLLDFVNEEEALTFVDDILENVGKAVLTPVQENNVHPTVVGVYKRPTQFCPCSSNSFTKGIKYGWWVCNGCRKPKRLYWRNALSGRRGFGIPEAYNLLEDYFEIDKDLTPEDVAPTPIEISEEDSQVSTGVEVHRNTL